jgi:hypothetical protein
LAFGARKATVVGTEEDDTRGGRKYSTPGGTVAGLRDLSDSLAGLNIDGAQNALTGIGWIAGEGTAHVAVAGLILHVGASENAVFVIRLHLIQLGHDVIQLGDGVPGRGIAIGSAIQPGAGQRVLVGRFSMLGTTIQGWEELSGAVVRNDCRADVAQLLQGDSEAEICIGVARVAGDGPLLCLDGIRYAANLEAGEAKIVLDDGIGRLQ